MPVNVPLFASSLERHHPALAEAAERVIAGGRYILGPEVQAFEREFADYLGVRHCVGVANGTDALAIALRALGVGPGDEVVLPSYTFYATAEATVDVGAIPVFCDVDPSTFCITREAVQEVVTPRTKAILAVHLYGNLAPVAELAELGLPVLEDAAQAAGATVDGRRAGSLGDAATYSFFPSKNLPCLGDGGAVVTDDDDVAMLARRLRFHGSDDKQTFVEVGYNSRLDELQAAFLRVLLPELDGWNAARREVARLYADGGLGEHVALPEPTPGAEHVYHLYVARHPDADAVVQRLDGAGIGARAYYRVPVHRQPAMARFGAGPLPGTEEAARTGMALPMGTGLSEEAVREVISACASGST
jgi:dTDP-3-amino-3,4,6-trideoxy-alpha-D-glucose transaminase